jgi:DivIVA domain-containing protein
MAHTDKTPRTLPALASAIAELTAARTNPDAIRTMTFKLTRKGFDPYEVSAYLDRLGSDVEILHNRIRQLHAEAEAPAAQPTAGGGRAEAAVLPAAVPPAESPSAEPERRAASEEIFERAGWRIAELMRTFEEDVRVSELQAKTNADALVAAARAEADELRLEARLAREEALADAAAAVAVAREEAERIGAEAQRRADELEGAAQRTLREAREQGEQILQAISSNRRGLIEDVRRLREGLVLTLARLDVVIDEREEGDRLIVVDEIADDAAKR